MIRFTCFILLIVFCVFGQVSDSDKKNLALIKKYYDNNELYEALRLIDITREIDIRDQDVLEYSIKILIDLKMYDNLKSKLETAILLNQKRFIPYEIEYLYLIKNYDKAMAKANDYLKRYLEGSNLKIYLIMARIFNERDGDKKKSLEIYNREQVVHLYNKNFLFEYLSFLLDNNTKKNDSKINELFQLYLNHYPGDYKRIYLESVYAYKKKEYKKSLNLINEVVNAFPQNKEYIRFKLNIIKKLDDVQLLLNLLTTKKIYSDWFQEYVLGYYNLYNINKLVNYYVSDKTVLEQKVFSHLLKASKTNLNEIGNYLLEELILKNYGINNVLLKNIIEDKQKYIETLFSAGNYDELYYQLSRLIEIDPLGIESRKLFMNYNYFSKYEQGYLEQLKILDGFYRNKNNEIKIKIKKNQKKLNAILLKKKYNILIDHVFLDNRKMVILDTKDIVQSAYTPGFEKIFKDMLDRFLKLETFFNFKQEFEVKEIYKGDYILKLRLNESTDKISGSIGLYTSDNNISLKETNFFFEDVRKVYRLITFIKNFIQENIAVTGKILKVDKDKVIIDLGYRDNVVLDGQVKVFNKNSKEEIVSSKIAVVNEYISMLELSIDDSMKINIGDEVFYLGLENKK